MKKFVAGLATVGIICTGMVTLSAPTASAEVYYANCTEAREAGAAPIMRGEPGYRPALDRDNDGIACE